MKQTNKYMNTTKIKANIIRRIALKGIKLCRSKQTVIHFHESDELEAALEAAIENIIYIELYHKGEAFFQAMNLLGKHLKFKAKYKH